MKMEKGLYQSKTTGSTGEPVKVERTYLDYVYFLASSLREITWKGWDVTKTYALIHPKYPNCDKPSWGLPSFYAQKQGTSYLHSFGPISELQNWLEEKNPHYIHVYPSILKQLDLSKLTNFIDAKGTGELGASTYSTEECGIVAISCPDNPEVFHVMENFVVEVESDGSILITSLTNPYIKRYRHGDHVELGTCFCGRKLQTITKIYGRKRGLFVMPNGDKKWPLIGSLDFYDKFGIKRYQAIQTSLDHLDLKIIAEPLGEKIDDLKNHIQLWLGVPINIHVHYVDSFDHYKHEEFISLVE
jgi:phenylacetate-CoA ligase